MDGTPQVAIIVLNWNGRDDSLACLNSVTRLDYPAYRVIVVDNGSVDESVPLIREQFPAATVIENEENLGYVGGNNVGLTQAVRMGADYALLLNNDTQVAPDMLSLLVKAASSDPAVGIVGPLIYYFDRPDVIWSAGGVIDWDHGYTRMIGLDQEDRGQLGNAPRPVDFVTGCALLIKVPLIEQIGPLDPRFFAYYEETEWCVRAARAGYKILLVPQAKMWHKISPVAREMSPQVHYYMTRNRLLFLKLSQAGLAPWFNTLVLDYGRTLLSWSFKPKWRYKASQRQVMLKAILDYWRGRFGKMGMAA